MGGVIRTLKCRIEESDHSRVVIFHREDGEEIFVLPAERFDPTMLEKLKRGQIRCDVKGPSQDGTSSLHLTNTEGEMVFEQKVWIRSATWTRLMREQER